MSQPKPTVDSRSAGPEGVEKAVPEADEQPSVLICDFCGHEVPSVSRVALDGDYERLRTAHAVKYACSACSEKKERVRLGLDRG